MKKLFYILPLVIVLLSGCATRSISDSGYNASKGYRSDNPLYQGELSEFNVLGISSNQVITEDQISNALKNSKERVELRKGDSILLIQSGAMIPDDEMIQNLEKYFSVSIFTGVPESADSSNTNYSKGLRLAAAKAGIEKIITYWGVLESGTKNLATKTISWLPVVGWTLPDESQEMRIRLKVALIDVDTGRWEIFVPTTFEDKSYSSMLNRRNSDQSQVATLKAISYEAAVAGIVSRYVK